MSRCVCVDLVFEKPPAPEALEAVNRWLRAEDYDAPVLKADGWSGQDWRSPMSDCEPDDLPSKLLAFGIVCRVRSVDRYDATDWEVRQMLDDRPWIKPPVSG